MPAGNAYPTGHLVPSPILGLANVPIVETEFLELAMSLLDFSPRIPFGTFSILLTNHFGFSVCSILFPNLTFYVIARVFHNHIFQCVTCQQKTLTPTNTWSGLTLELACLLMLRPISPELVLFQDL